MSKGGKTRQRIIEKSAPVFNQLGYGGTSMSTLMEVTGLEKGGLYRHFVSKEELACESFEYTCRVANESKLMPVEKVEGGLERLEEFIRVFVSKRPPVAGGCPIFNTAVESDDGNPVLKKLARNAYKMWVDRIAQWVMEAKEEKSLRADVDPQDLASFIFCSLEGALIAQNLTGDKSTLSRSARHLHKYLDSLSLRI